MSTVIDDTEVKSHLSTNIRQILEDRKLNGAWLMNVLGLKEGTFYPVYNGEVVPRLGVTARIAEVLGVTIDELLKKPREKREFSKSQKSA